MRKILYAIGAGFGSLLLSACLHTPAVDLPLTAQISANGAHSVYVDNQGRVWTWGGNQFGALGDGTTISRSSPKQVTGLPVIAKVAVGGEHTFVLTQTGDVWAWGFNADNTLGVSTPSTTQTTPVLVPGLDHIVDIATGDGHGVALRSDGTIWVWGINVDGQLGVGDAIYRPFPEQIPQFSDAIAVAAGDSHTLVLRKDRTVWTAGANDEGQLGQGDTTPRTSFVKVEGLENIIQLAAAEDFSIALDAYGDIWGVGDNGLGQLTSAASEEAFKPVRILTATSGQPYRQIDAGGEYVLALDDAGTVWSWGYNGFRQLGYSTSELVSAQPNVVPILETVTSITAADNHALALGVSGNIWTWGDSSEPHVITVE